MSTLTQIAHKERELEEMRRVVERSASHHSDAAAKPHLISQLRAKDDQIKVSNFDMHDKHLWCDKTLTSCACSDVVYICGRVWQQLSTWPCWPRKRQSRRGVTSGTSWLSPCAKWWVSVGFVGTLNQTFEICPFLCFLEAFIFIFLLDTRITFSGDYRPSNLAQMLEEQQRQEQVQQRSHHHQQQQEQQQQHEEVKRLTQLSGFVLVHYEQQTFLRMWILMVRNVPFVLSLIETLVFPWWSLNESVVQYWGAY